MEPRRCDCLCGCSAFTYMEQSSTEAKTRSLSAAADAELMGEAVGFDASRMCKACGLATAKERSPHALPAVKAPDEPGRWLTQDELYKGGLEFVLTDATTPLYGLQVYNNVGQAVESLKAQAETAGLEMWVYIGDPTKLPGAPPISTPSGPGLWVYAVPWGPEMVEAGKKLMEHMQTPEGAAAMRLPWPLPKTWRPLLNKVPGYESLVNYLSSAVHPHEVPDDMVLAHITPDNILLVALEVLRSRSTENPQPTQGEPDEERPTPAQGD